MVNKKYLLLAGFAAMFGTAANAQESQSSTTYRDMTYRGGIYDVLDTAYIPKSRMQQQRDFLEYRYDFPAKPRSMWEIGVGAGLYNISGDVASLMLWNKGGYGFHAHVRKSLGYVLSTRLQYNYGVGKGLDWQSSTSYSKNSAWMTNDYNAASPTAAGPLDPVYYNYRMESHQLNWDWILNMNNILFHKARNWFNIHAFAGIGGLAYQTRVNALDANGNKYSNALGNGVFNTVDGNPTYNNSLYENRKAIRADLQAGMDDTYETLAESDRVNRKPGIFGNKTLVPVASVGLGVAFKISPRVNIQLEDRISSAIGSGEDLLDGNRWQEHPSTDPALSPNKDGINYFSVGVNFNLGSSKSHVEPLYWVNPLGFAYNELTSPRRMKVPAPDLADDDGDGVINQMDKCPGTPAGVAVDTHGCPIDTDGDGVPDDRDKQLITPTECQPVDADGVGECPCHCEGVVGTCANIGAGSLNFTGGSTRLNAAQQSQLSNLAAQMSAQPTCKVVVIGNGSGSKVQQQRSWDRVNAIIAYMSESHGIDRGRFIFQYGGSGNPETVTYRPAQSGEDGSSNPAPPFPNLRRD